MIYFLISIKRLNPEYVDWIQFMDWFFSRSRVKCFIFCENSFYFYWFLRSFQQLYSRSHSWWTYNTVRTFLFVFSSMVFIKLELEQPFPLCLFKLRNRKGDICCCLKSGYLWECRPMFMSVKYKHNIVQKWVHHDHVVKL